MLTNLLAERVVPQFAFAGRLEEIEPFGNGHINSTYRVTFLEGAKKKRYILQRINTGVFRNPDQLMENIRNVTDFLRKKIVQRGGDPTRETLTLIPLRDGRMYLEDAEMGCWRAYLFIEGAECYERVERPALFYHAARAFGRFQSLLADYPARTLHETIPNFHNTVSRFADFARAVREDRAGRLHEVGPEAAFIFEREKDCGVVTALLASGEIPLRVTHNDTKLNNIMMDASTDEGVCVVDLDTVMPGSSLYDFGDSIRFGASTAAEDEKDLGKVQMDLTLFETYAKGYLSEALPSMTRAELAHLAFSARLMTLECGMRFLGDYLNGDTYFKTDYSTHNKDRARTQLKLVADMEQKRGEMEQIIESLL